MSTNGTLSHDGGMTERVVLDYTLDPPIDYTEPRTRSRQQVTTWRYTAVRFAFDRSSSGPGEEWSDWRLRISGTAANVLVSGATGQRTPYPLERHLVEPGTQYGPLPALDAWCAAAVQPLLDDAVVRRDEAAWARPW